MSTKKRRRFILKVDTDMQMDGTPTVEQGIGISMHLLNMVADTVGLTYNELLDEIKEVNTTTKEEI